MMQPKGKSVGKMYGNPSFETGPKAGAGNQSMPKGNGAKGSMMTGPGLDKGPDAGIGKAKQAKGSMGGGTKADKAGEDSSGSASGKRGNVKA